MMELSLQIKSLVLSFIYGILLSYIIRLQYKYLFMSKFIYKIILNIFFMFDITMVYFYILRIVNNGVFHLYFLIILILGYLLGNSLIHK